MRDVVIDGLVAARQLDLPMPQSLQVAVDETIVEVDGEQE